MRGSRRGKRRLRAVRRFAVSPKGSLHSRQGGVAQNARNAEIPMMSVVEARSAATVRGSPAGAAVFHRVRDLSPPFRVFLSRLTGKSVGITGFPVVDAPLVSLRSSAMEPLKDSSN